MYTWPLSSLTARVLSASRVMRIFGMAGAYLSVSGLYHAGPQESSRRSTRHTTCGGGAVISASPHTLYGFVRHIPLAQTHTRYRDDEDRRSVLRERTQPAAHFAVAVSCVMLAAPDAPPPRSSHAGSCPFAAASRGWSPDTESITSVVKNNPQGDKGS